MHICQLSPSKLFRRSNFGDLSRLAFLAGILTIFSLGCKKGSDIEPKPNPSPKSVSDSISFQMDGKTHASNETNSTYIANGGANLKLLDTPVPGKKIWATIGHSSLYSSVDSVYFSYGKEFVNSTNNMFKISFGKGFHVKNLNPSGNMWYPKDIRNILDMGKHNFATDYRNFNLIDGVSFDFYKLGTSGMPERPHTNSPDDYSQQDAKFEIFKKEQINEDTYRIEAKFEMNIYDADRKKHRVTNGFLRFTIYRDFIVNKLF